MPTIRSVHPLAGAPAPTLDGLIGHFQKYGLSEKTGYRGKTERYSTYKKLAEDPLVQVGFDYLGERAYTTLIEAVGYHQFADAARADWRESRGIE